MIPLPPHRTKGRVVIGARGPGDEGPFGFWGADTQPETEESPAAGPGARPPQHAGDGGV